MKKTMYSIALAALSVMLAAQTYTGVFFSGIGASYEYPAGVPHNTWNYPFQNQLDEAYAVYSGIPNQVVIGHSLGGMRSLAYLNKMVNSGATASNIKGIIMTGGPVRGYTPLANGVDALGGRMKTFVKSMLKGVEACTLNTGFLVEVGYDLDDCFDFIDAGVIYPLSEKYVPDMNFLDIPLKDIVRSFVSGRLSRFTNTLCGDQVIKDLTPGQTYVKDNLNPKSVLVTPGHYENVYVGGEIGYMTVWIEPVYSTSPRIPSNANVYIGYIYGTIGDPLADIASIQTGGETIPIEQIRGYFPTFRGVFEKAQVKNSALSALNTSLAILAPGASLKIMYAALALNHGTAATNAKTAKDICADYKGYYNKNILNTTQGSDGFIPVEAVTRPLTETGGKAYALKQNGSPDYTFCDAWSHQGMLTEPRIWGTGGSFANPQKSGKIYEWLYAKSFQNALDNRRYMEGKIQ